MSKTLNDYTKAELLAYAEEFGTEAKPTLNKADIVALLEEDGISVDFIAEQEKARAEEEPEIDAAFIDNTELEPVAPAAADDDEDVVLVRMVRANPTYEIRGHVFRSTHPYALVKESDADYLIEEHGGFRMASPKEVREFYS
jgi:hypothetical protein